MTDTYVDLGAVTAPSGVLVLGMAGWMDFWPETGRSLSERAMAAAASGGGHLYESAAGQPLPWSGEAFAVPAAVNGLLHVRALPAPSPFDGKPTIAVLEVNLGMSWPENLNKDRVVLGDMPVDRCGIILGDARALDSFTGLDGEATNGLADVTYWGKYAEDIKSEFGGEGVRQHPAVWGWTDLSMADAELIADKVRAWVREGPGSGLMVSVNPHTDIYRLGRAGWSHPLLAGVADVGGSQVLGIGWDSGDHSMRHRGERAHGQVYPMTLESREGDAVLCWTILSKDAQG